MRLKYEPASEPLHVSVKLLFLPRKAMNTAGYEGFPVRTGSWMKSHVRELQYIQGLPLKPCSSEAGPSRTRRYSGASQIRLSPAHYLANKALSISVLLQRVLREAIHTAGYEGFSDG